MRAIIFILSLAVCFFVGVLYGIKQERSVEMASSPLPVIETTEENRVIHEQSAETEETIVTTTNLIHTDTTPAYKAASALETVVDFFYEMIIGILYQLSKLFY